jgi:hypothetical protein
MPAKLVRAGVKAVVTNYGRALQYASARLQDEKGISFLGLPKLCFNLRQPNRVTRPISSALS